MICDFQHKMNGLKLMRHQLKAIRSVGIKMVFTVWTLVPVKPLFPDVLLIADLDP